MADLIDRLAFDGVDERPHIGGHEFIGTMYLYAHSILDRATVVSYLDLEGSEATQAGLIADEIDNAIGIDAKVAYISRVQAVVTYLDVGHQRYITDEENQIIDKVTVQSDLRI